MKGKLVVVSILVIIVLGLFIMGNLMTVSPGASSGNGNPAHLLLIGIIPLFFVLSFLWISLFQLFSIRTSSYIVGLFAVLFHLTVAFLYQRSELNDYREVIGQALASRNGTADMIYLKSITSGWTIHVNNQYFNLNTFLMFMTASIFVAIMYCLWDQWDQYLSIKKKNRYS